MRHLTLGSLFDGSGGFPLAVDVLARIVEEVQHEAD